MGFRETVATCLAAGERVTVHFRWDRRELSWKVRAPEPLPPEHLIHLVEADGCSYVEPRRLFGLPLARARALLELAKPSDRETYSLHDALERALRRPELFGGAAYAHLPTPTDLPRAKAMPPPEWPDAGVPPEDHWYGPWCSDYGVRKKRDPNDPAYLATLAQLGMGVDNDNGHTTITRPPPGPEAPESAAYWRARLLELDHGPTWLNGVPVRREACEGAWFQVGTCEDPPDVHYQRLRLSDAVQRVRSGHFPRLKPGPKPHRACIACSTTKVDSWPGAFSWCTTCAGHVCRDCHNDHFAEPSACAREAG